jgi:hypothetical protein
MSNTPVNMDQRHNEPKRGGCLDVFLVVALIFQIVSFCGQLDTIARIQEYATPHSMLYIIMFMRLGAAVSTIALLNWKKWGYNGLFTFYVMVIVLSFSAGDLFMTILNSGELLIFWFLAKPIKDYLD